MDSTLDTGVESDAAHDALVSSDSDTGIAQDSSLPSPGLLSLNLHCLKVSGTNFATNQERFAAIASAVKAENVGVIAVQEACVTPSQDAIAMLRDALQSSTGVPWQKAWVSAHVAWQGTPDEAQEGVGILSRDSLSDVQELEYWHQGALRRVALGATLGGAMDGVRLWSVHFEYQDLEASTWQARETAAWTVAQADPSLGVVVAGDFNAQEGFAPHASLIDFGFRDLTDALNATRIDHILAHRGAPLALIEARTLFDGNAWPTVSDHHGVMVRLSPGTGDQVVVTRLQTSASLPAGSHLTIRGNALPLNWSQGWPAARLASASKLVLTEIPQGAVFDYKWLLDDTTWQTGSNLTSSGGASAQDSPTF
jgi:endonuclease/exonuclease/phosphatase family metal-dependent hydrolase